VLSFIRASVTGEKGQVGAVPTTPAAFWRSTATGGTQRGALIGPEAPCDFKSIYHRKTTLPKAGREKDGVLKGWEMRVSGTRLIRTCTFICRDMVIRLFSDFGKSHCANCATLNTSILELWNKPMGAILPSLKEKAHTC
jgi:hypothetical protein